MAVLQRTPGPKVTRMLEDPARFVTGAARNEPGVVAGALVAAHNAAVQRYGSNSGGMHAFDPAELETEGVYEPGGVYPRHTVVTRLAWGKIDPGLAQRILEMDGLA